MQDINPNESHTEDIDLNESQTEDFNPNESQTEDINPIPNPHESSQKKRSWKDSHSDPRTLRKKKKVNYSKDQNDYDSSSREASSGPCTSEEDEPTRPVDEPISARNIRAQTKQQTKQQQKDSEEHF